MFLSVIHVKFLHCKIGKNGNTHVCSLLFVPLYPHHCLTYSLFNSLYHYITLTLSPVFVYLCVHVCFDRKIPPGHSSEGEQ